MPVQSCGHGIERALVLMCSNQIIFRDKVLYAFMEVFIVMSGTKGKELLAANNEPYRKELHQPRP